MGFDMAKLSCTKQEVSKQHGYMMRVPSVRQVLLSDPTKFVGMAGRCETVTGDPVSLLSLPKMKWACEIIGRGGDLEEVTDPDVFGFVKAMDGGWPLVFKLGYQEVFVPSDPREFKKVFPFTPDPKCGIAVWGHVTNLGTLAKGMGGKTFTENELRTVAENIRSSVMAINPNMKLPMISDWSGYAGLPLIFGASGVIVVPENGDRVYSPYTGRVIWEMHSYESTLDDDERRRRHHQVKLSELYALCTFYDGRGNKKNCHFVPDIPSQGTARSIMAREVTHFWPKGIPTVYPRMMPR